MLKQVGHESNSLCMHQCLAYEWGLEMRSDKEFFKLFQAYPDLLKLLASTPEDAVYTFRSEVFKEVERRIDGYFQPENPDHPHFILEVQVAPDVTIYTRLVMEMAMAFMKHQPKGTTQEKVPDIRALLLFFQESSDPKTEPWCSFVRACPDVIQIVYLDQIVRQLGENESTHPVWATFQPLFAKDDLTLIHRLPDCHQAILDAKMPAQARKVLQDVFMSWLLQRFKNKTHEEIKAMFIPSDPTPIQDSILYKSLLEDQERIHGISFEELSRTVKEQKRALSKQNQVIHDKNQEIHDKDNEIRRLQKKLRSLGML